MSRAARLMVAIAALVGAGIVTTTPDAVAEVPRSQRIFMVSDSVGIGAESAMRAAFPGTQFTLVGKPGQFVETLAASYVAPMPSSVFGDVAIVAGGYNYPYWDPARFDRSVDLMVSTLLSKGVKYIAWVTLRELEPQYMSAASWRQAQSYAFYLPTVNLRLRMALARHPSLSLIDWASIANRPGLTYDAIHLNTAGAAEYAALAAQVAGTLATRIPAGTTRVVPVAGLGGVNPSATGVAVTVTAVNPRTDGFITVWPCGGTKPWVSNLNVLPATITASSIILPLGTDGTLCTFANIDTNLIIDVTGQFLPGSGFTPVVPTRAVDTRDTAIVSPGQVLTVPLNGVPGLPTDRRAAVINLTTIGGWTAAEVRAFPCDAAPPALPSRRTDVGAIQNLMLLAATDAAGQLCITASQPTQVIVDVFGGFDATADVGPLPPRIVYDSRGGWPLPATGVATAAIEAGRSGALVNVETTNPSGPGFITAWPCDAERPTTSMLNTLPNRIQSGSALVGLDAAGAMCLYTMSGTHLTVSTTATIGAAFTRITPFRALDSRLG